MERFRCIIRGGVAVFRTGGVNNVAHSGVVVDRPYHHPEVRGRNRYSTNRRSVSAAVVVMRRALTPSG